MEKSQAGAVVARTCGHPERNVRGVCVTHIMSFARHWNEGADV
ncbi:hypothetical protein [Microtetraspora sp. AC03309]|nr:hypothetical protein [Microtetraspora sp. AC03309]